MSTLVWDQNVEFSVSAEMTGWDGSPSTVTGFMGFESFTAYKLEIDVGHREMAAGTYAVSTIVTYPSDGTTFVMGFYNRDPADTTSESIHTWPSESPVPPTPSYSSDPFGGSSCDLMGPCQNMLMRLKTYGEATAG